MSDGTDRHASNTGADLGMPSRGSGLGASYLDRQVRRRLGKDEFELMWCLNNGTSVEQAHLEGRQAYRCISMCNKGDRICHGWVMLLPDQAVHYLLTGAIAVP